MDWEITACSLDVESTIPPELGGVYLRNGPNPAPGEFDGPYHVERWAGCSVRPTS
jgi:carotenoid cleavage dioxygenase